MAMLRRIPALRHTWIFLAEFYVLAAVWGVRSIWFWLPNRLDLIVPIALSVALALWSIADARHRGRPIPLFVRSWFVIFGAFLVPLYVVWTRRWPGVGWLTVHAALWYLLCTLVMNAGGLLIYRQDWLRAFEM
jgi:hypothetical protein